MDKKTRALKLALDVLTPDPEEAFWFVEKKKEKAITALREALAEQPAQQALDKKAENARELGLDYEPVWGGGPSNKDYEDAMRLRRLNELAKPAQQQEPVAWRFTGIAGLKRYMTQKQYDAQQPGVKKWYEPFMCANCTSLLAQRKPLMDDEIHQCFLASEQGQDGTEFRKAFARAIEAAHGIKGEA